MKYLKLNTIAFLLFSMALGLTSCSTDEPQMGNGEEPKATQGFKVGPTEYKTPKAYLIYHSTFQYNQETMKDETKYLNRFSILLMDGSATTQDRNLYFSTDTKHSSYHHFRDAETKMYSTLDQVLIESKSHVQAASTETRVNISGLSNNLECNGVFYGDPVWAGINYPLSTEDTAVFTINSIEIDHEKGTGTIDCDYSITPSLDGAIVGNYKGEFEVLVR